MIRPGWGALLAACVCVGPLAAQSSSRWALSLGLEGLRFGATARDTISEPPSAVEIRPSGRIGARVAVRRSLGGWTAGLTVGFAPGNVEAANDAVAIRDRTADLSRYRAALTVERHLARLGDGLLSVELEPTLDLWSLDGETRTGAGFQGGVLLRLPLGGLEVEQRLTGGLSASPLEPADLGGEFDLRRLWAVGFGAGVRVPL